MNFFTALVEPNRAKSEARDRQKRYLNALGTLRKVRIIHGKYQDQQVTCRANCCMEYFVPEEKKTDVNIAVNILNDAVKATADCMVIVSGDSDIQPAINWVCQNYPAIKITVYLPALPEDQGNRRNDFYNQIGVTCRFLPLDRLGHHQLPPKLWLMNGAEVERPKIWCQQSPTATIQ